jgi:hypothetical protein
MTNLTCSDEKIKSLNNIIDNIDLEENIKYLSQHIGVIKILNNRAAKADALIKHQNEYKKNQQAIQKHYQQIENRLNSLTLFEYINKYGVSNKLKKLLLSSKAISIFKEIYLIDLIKINTIDKKSIFLRLVEALLSPDNSSIEEAFASVGRDLKKYSANKQYIDPDDDYLENVE